jgi:hypothetical protein
MNSESSDLVTIRTMMGAKNLELAIKCLGSVLRFCRHPAEILIHEDGSLDEAAREKLETSLTRVRFQDRIETNAIMEEKLRSHPLCRAFRRRHIFAPQVLDIPMLTPMGKRVVYCDTDILLTRPIECRPFFLGGGMPFTGTRDLRESYSVHLKHWPLLGKLGVRLGSRLCAGMMSFDLAVHDVDYIEWLLRLDEEHRIFSAYPFFTAQTFCAALAARAGPGSIDPKECVVAHASNMTSARKASIIHFAGYSRNHFDKTYRAIDPEAEHWPPKQLAIVPVPVCGIGRRVLNAARARIFLRRDAMGAR